MSEAIVKRTLGLAPAVEAHFWDWLETLERSFAEERQGLEEAAAFVRSEAFTIQDNDGLEVGADIVRGARERLKSVEEDRKRFTVPLLSAKALVDTVYKGLTVPLSDTVEKVKAKMGAYTVQLEAKRRAEMQASAALYQAGGTPVAIIPEAAQAKGVTVKRVWVARVVEPDLVPRELCSPDEDKIKKAIAYADTDNPPRPIPGLEFVQEERTTVR